ncbi:MAG: FAD-binding protein, partial [Deltaproteobacteria bacterium]|nr:FAD-binding protein [Deltaproteobacteria bacterium]
RGYLSEDALLVGVESRTSAPVRIPRDTTTLMSPDVDGLFPSGEGGGYSGGIVSAALDGINVARAVERFVAGR